MTLRGGSARLRRIWTVAVPPLALCTAAAAACVGVQFDVGAAEATTGAPSSCNVQTWANVGKDVRQVPISTLVRSAPGQLKKLVGRRLALSGALVSMTRLPGGDVYVSLRDPSSSATVGAVFPDPVCAARAAPPMRRDLGRARADLFTLCGQAPASKQLALSGSATIIGIGALVGRPPHTALALEPVLHFRPAGCHAAAAPAPADVTIDVDRSRPIETSHLTLGVTHTQYSLDPWGNAAAISRAQTLLRQVAVFENQHIYGWGTGNPEPRPGSFAWASLDRRVNLIRSTGGTPVITLCCAPDWMTRLGSTTSRYPNLPPTPAHYRDFADLARRIAQRYRDVRYYQVWNEMKGFWAGSTWDYVAYTDMYNAVYDALKSVNPSINVGGPYIPITVSGGSIAPRDLQALQYWLAHAHGADFVTVDHVASPSDTSPDAVFTGAADFESIAAQVHSLTPLPLWWAEDYAMPIDHLEHTDDAFQAAALASILEHELIGGSAVSLRWGPQGVADRPYNGDQESLFSDTRDPAGGAPFPAYAVYRIFHDAFPSGTPLYAAQSSSSAVEVLASARKTLLINTRSYPVSVFIDGRQISLRAYAVALVS